MNSSAPTLSMHRLLGALALAAGVLFSTPARAALDSPVTVSLIAPGGVGGDATPLSWVDVVDPATGITAGDDSNIGQSAMLEGEFVRFVDNAIHVHVAAGDLNAAGDSITGLLGAGGAHARYEFENLAISGQVIVGVAVYAFDGFANSGFSGVASPLEPTSYIRLVGHDRVTFELDDLVFKSRGETPSSLDYAEFRIDLLTTPVPEPASALLLLLGLAAFGVHRSARRRP